MKQFLLTLLMVIFGSAPAWAHGVGYHIDNSQTACIRIAYDDGEPMSYAKVKVFGPGNAAIEHQNGRTDKNGRFAFVPDTPGPWRVEAGDGMGHAIKAEVNFTPDQAQDKAPADPPKDQGPSVSKAMAGLSLIFFLSGAFFWWKGTRVARPGSASA